MRRIQLLPTLFLAFPLTARAGFLIEATPSAAQPQVGSPAVLPSPYAVPRALPVAHPPTARPVAVGMGIAVPLRSALLDIVPPDLHPVYTDAVDPNAVVTWKGGKPWDVVLQDAVKPLEITVAVKGTNVILSR